MRLLLVLPKTVAKIAAKQCQFNPDRCIDMKSNIQNNNKNRNANRKGVSVRETEREKKKNRKFAAFLYDFGLMMT